MEILLKNINLFTWFIGIISLFGCFIFIRSMLSLEPREMKKQNACDELEKAKQRIKELGVLEETKEDLD